MKTAATIERQEARKQVEKTGSSCSHNSAPVRAKYDHRIDAERLKPFHFKPGQSGNPGGRPKVDLAGEIARAIFEQDGQAIFAAFQKMLRKGSPYAFEVLSNRAYGKLRETYQVEVSPYQGVSDEDLIARIKQLEQQLGFSTPEELPPTGESKPN